MLYPIKALIHGRDQYLLHTKDATGKNSDGKTNQTEVEILWSARKRLFWRLKTLFLFSVIFVLLSTAWNLSAIRWKFFGSSVLLLRWHSAPSHSLKPRDRPCWLFTRPDPNTASNNSSLDQLQKREKDASSSHPSVPSYGWPPLAKKIKCISGRVG